MPYHNARRRYAQGRHDFVTVLVDFVILIIALAGGLFLAVAFLAGAIFSLIS